MSPPTSTWTGSEPLGFASGGSLVLLPVFGVQLELLESADICESVLCRYIQTW